MTFAELRSKYTFRRVGHCEMCGERAYRRMGVRLNRSQGFRPPKSGTTVTVKQCQSCGLVYSDPRPIPKRLSDHYGVPPEEYWGTIEEWSPEIFAEPIRDAKRLLPFRPGMTALDIGVGTGLAMRSLSHAGFDTWGIEPSEPFYERAVQNVDAARLKLATIEEAEFPPASFDFITFGAVLEHLQEPRAAIDKAMKWLKPGGIIHAEVPNARWLIARLVNLYYRLIGTRYVTNLSPMHPPFHLYEFTPRSFKRYRVVKHRVDVCTVVHCTRLPRPLMWLLMKATGTGMQLTVYLRAKE
jgi:2-polyprenyl-3-methyl-5-hydroxy-6-metoxy-1,4-benzoquinol methylase